MINQEKCKTCAYNLDCDRIFCPKEIQIPEPEPAPAGGLVGWICPVCGRGLSPYTDSCPCVVNWEITYGTGTPLPQQGETISHAQHDNISANTYVTSRCHKCINENGCSKNLDNNGECPLYKRDPKDGGYYG